jgi:two-component system, NarL family, response regulator DevR
MRPPDCHPAPIGVFLLDDHEIVRRGLRELLGAEPDMQIVGEAGTAAAAVAGIPSLDPDVAVLDVRLPDGDGVSVCRDIRSRSPRTACLMLTGFSDEEAFLSAAMAGAAGYLPKQIRGSDLVGAVRTVAGGTSLLDPQAVACAMQRLDERAAQRARADPMQQLTRRQRQVLEMIGEGLTNQQIAERMFLSEKTVKNLASGMYVKLGLRRRAQAAAYLARAQPAHPAGT